MTFGFIEGEKASFPIRWMPCRRRCKLCMPSDCLTCVNSFKSPPGPRGAWAKHRLHVRKFKISRCSAMVTPHVSKAQSSDPVGKIAPIYAHECQIKPVEPV